MNTLKVNQTRWLALTATALLFGTASIAQAGWIAPSPTTYAASVSNFVGPGYQVTIKDSGGTTLYSNGSGAGAFRTDLDGAGSLPSFITYCADLNHTLSPPSLTNAGLWQGNDASGGRRISDAATLANYVYTLTDARLSSIGASAAEITNANLLSERQAALQIAIWAILYNGTGTSSNGDVNALAQRFITWGKANADATTKAFFVDYKPFATGPTGTLDFDQDQIKPIPIPAALFFVAPALIGVLGGMRRKQQALVA